MNDWLPIETVPQDGTTIFLCCALNAHGETTKGEDWGLFVKAAAWWADGGAGVWIVHCGLRHDPRLNFEPSHWQPLPFNPVV